jgi:ankyrin repeat protein
MQDAIGDTPMHRTARKGDWEAVKALARRDGDPSALDRWGEFVLHRAIRAKQWDTVKLLIQFQGDIHQAAADYVYGCGTATPLQMLIDARQGEMIEHTLPWCPDQWKGVNDRGETTLHAVCLSGWPNTLYYLLARGVNPRAVKEGGHSALPYAVLCEECPQKMVAECVTLGLCALQPRITEHERRGGWWLSPFVLAVMRGLPVVTKILYESGSCSNTELFRLQAQLVEVVYAEPSEDPSLRRMFLESINDYRSDLRGFVRKPVARSAVLSSARYVLEVSATPRSLQSACRLVISRCVNVRRQRHRDGVYAQLLLPPSLQDYVVFSDLTDPGYGQHETDGGEEHSEGDSSDYYGR